MADLLSAKSHLVDALRDRKQRYWDLMKSWYRRKITKEDFDAKAQGLLGENNVHLHNEFLFAILVKCQTGVAPQETYVPMTQSVSPAESLSPIQPPAIKKPKILKPKVLMATELPYGALDPLHYFTPPTVKIFKDLDSILLCSHELVLPDVSTLHARMLLGAWEADLEDVSEDCAHVLLHSLKVFLKNVLQMVISHRTSWKLDGRNFQHSFGNGDSRSNPLLDNSQLLPRVQRSLYQYKSGERVEADSVARLSSRVGGIWEPINLFHLRDALLVNQQCILVFSIYACIH
ncbi:transcriptional adapter 1-like isoform X2 [Halichondria panicea]|uniref:transcriptional adapter 1-like isoform X2 n=1 Tax=Halichondria panicea TaxID=6063 RepID=UPI00312B94A2